MSMSSAPESLFWLLHLSANLRRMQPPVLNHAMMHRLLHAGAMLVGQLDRRFNFDPKIIHPGGWSQEIVCSRALTSN
jgi:hypothetical protein